MNEERLRENCSIENNCNPNQGKDIPMSADKLAIREAQWNDADLSGIWDLCRQSFDAYRSCTLSEFRELQRHKWLTNPARTPDHPFGWILFNRKDGIVGFVGLVPVRLKIGAEVVIGAAGHTWVVSPAYRGYSLYSLSLYKQLLSWADKHFLLNTTSIETTSRINRILRMTKIPVESFDRLLLWVIRPEALVQWRLENSSWNQWSRMTARRPFAWLLKVAARVRFVGHKRLRFHDATLPVEPVKVFTDEFTKFWEDHKHEYGIATVRDRTFLQWRHLDVPAIMGAMHVFACRDNGRLQGYLALIERYRQKGSCPGHFRVTDVFYDRHRQDVVCSLMNYAFEFAKARGCSVFEVSKVSQELGDLLRSQQPYVRQADSWTYWFKTPTPELADVCRREVWWPSGSDGDSNLF
jgi:hypothetical protein